MMHIDKCGNVNSPEPQNMQVCSLLRISPEIVCITFYTDAQNYLRCSKAGVTGYTHTVDLWRLTGPGTYLLAVDK